MTIKPTKDNRKKFDIDLAYGQVREDAIKDMTVNIYQKKDLNI